MKKRISHLKGRKYTGLGIMSNLNEKMGKLGNKDATMGQNEPKMSQIKPDKVNVRENSLTYFLNYTGIDKNKKPVLKWNKLSNVNFLHFTRS